MEDMPPLLSCPVKFNECVQVRPKQCPGIPLSCPRSQAAVRTGNVLFIMRSLPGPSWCGARLCCLLAYSISDVFLFCALSVFTVNWPSAFPLENRFHSVISAAWNNHMRSCWMSMFNGCYKHRVLVFRRCGRQIVVFCMDSSSCYVVL